MSADGEEAPHPRGDDWLFWDPETIHRYPDVAGGPVRSATAPRRAASPRAGGGERIRERLAGDLLVYLAGVVAGAVALASLLLLLSLQQLRAGLATSVHLSAPPAVASAVAPGPKKE